MDISFGLVTDGKNDTYLQELVNSIHRQQIPKYEIIIVGDTKVSSCPNTKIIPFDETIKNGWITKKKNLIAQVAKYDTLVIMHDYLKLDDSWYKGFLTFGQDFQICTTKILTHTGKRFRDYILFPLGLDNVFRQHTLLPYTIPLTPQISKLMYISGSFFVIKKELFLKYPLNESLTWGQQEDLEFTQRLKKHEPSILFKCNPYSTVYIQKTNKSCSYEELTSDRVELLLSYNDSEYETFYKTQDKILQDSFSQTL